MHVIVGFILREKTANKYWTLVSYWYIYMTNEEEVYRCLQFILKCVKNKLDWWTNRCIEQECVNSRTQMWVYQWVTVQNLSNLTYWNFYKRMLEKCFYFRGAGFKSKERKLSFTAAMACLSCWVDQMLSAKWRPWMEVRAGDCRVHGEWGVWTCQHKVSLSCFIRYSNRIQ